jgi:glycosyltransferase involved in cell wall biosynthesis
MAKIAFFTERLPTADCSDSDPVAGFAYELIRSLADQQHDIRVFSTYREGAELPESHPRIQIARPFRSWSWLELPKILPMLLEFQPDVLHLIQPRGEALQGFTNAMSALPGFAPLIGRPVIVSSFYDLRDENLKNHRMLLLTSDAITVSNEPQLRLIGKYIASVGRSSKILILPVPGRALTTEKDAPLEADRPEALMRTASAGTPWIFVPGDVSDQREPKFLFREFARALYEESSLNLVIGGGWGRSKIPARERHAMMRIFDEFGVGNRVLLTGPLSIEVERWCLMKASFSFTAALPAEALGLQRVLREALEVAAPLMLSDEQAHLDALSWSHGENSLIVRREFGLWSDAILKAIRQPALLEHIRLRLPEFSRSEAVDQPGNVMSRIYAGILDERRLR